MEISLPAWLGALCGMIVAAAIYAAAIRFVEQRLRRASGPKTREQAAAFEDRLSAVRRLLLGFGVAILAAAGYWIGGTFGDKIFGAHGG